MLHQTWPRSELGASGACRRGRSQQCQLHHVSPSHRVLKDWGAPEAAGITGSCGASRWPKELSWWPRLHGLDLCHWAAPPAPLTSDSINLTGKQGSGFLCAHILQCGGTGQVCGSCRETTEDVGAPGAVALPVPWGFCSLE